jgi:hypothetical protein
VGSDMKKKLLFLPLCFVPYFLVLSGCNHINKLFNLNTSFYCDYYSLFSTSENGEYYNGDNYIEGSGQYANIAFVKLIGGSGSLTLDIEVKQQIQYSTTLTINLG